jgi:hypothetical protein
MTLGTQFNKIKKKALKMGLHDRQHKLGIGMSLVSNMKVNEVNFSG